MGRLIGLVMMVAALWAGSIIYMEGVEGLTGRFVSSDAPEAAEPAEVRSLPQRFGDAVDGEMRKREELYAERLDHFEDLSVKE